MTSKMSRKKSLGRAPSFGASLARCFRGDRNPSVRTVGFLEHLDAGYDRLGFADEGVKEEEVRVIHLGKPASSGSKERAKRSLSLCMSRDSKGSLSSRVKGVIDVARKTTPHLNELFVGNQLLMQVTSCSLPRHGKNLTPSAGFVDNSIRNADSFLHER